MKNDPKIVTFTIRLSKSDMEALERFAEKTQRTKADAARSAIHLADNLIVGSSLPIGLDKQVHNEHNT